ncbi:hypothetical protein BH11PSE11_BH11PSE11_19300 [soil metagenome]
MNLFKRSASGIFASESLLGHLLRGLLAGCLLYWAFQHPEQGVLSVLAALGALLAFGGCPVCWSIGLLETLAQSLRKITKRGTG